MNSTPSKKYEKIYFEAYLTTPLNTPFKQTNYEFMKQHEDYRFVKGLLENNHSIVTGIYVAFRPGIISYVKRNKGTREDGKDLFQEGLRAILKMAVRKDFVLKCSFYWLLKRICMNKWINRLGERGRLPTANFADAEHKISGDESGLEEKKEQERRHNLLWKNIDKLPDKCKVLMRLRLVQKRKFKDIDPIMHYKKGGAKLAFHRCKEKLFKLFGEDDDPNEENDGGALVNF